MHYLSSKEFCKFKSKYYSRLNFNPFLPIGRQLYRILTELFKSGKWSPTAFQKSSVLVKKIYQPIGGEFHFAVFERVLQILKQFVLSG
jgi:hypothetical protein